MNLFQLGDFTLNSGRKSRLKIECDAWTAADVDCLAFLIAKRVGPFGSVEGVPRGGLRLADALAQYEEHGDGIPHLIVDDVLTTGGSMERLLAARNREGKTYRVMGAVVFARGNPLPWVKALFPLPQELWDV